LLCRVPNDPYDVMGCWISDKHFVSGWLNSEDSISSMFFLFRIPDHPPEETPQEPDHFFPYPQIPYPNSVFFKRILFSCTQNCTMRHVRAFRKAKQPLKAAADLANNSQQPEPEAAGLQFHSSYLPTSTEEEDKELKALVSECDIYLAFICSSDESVFAPNQVAFINVTKSLLDKTYIDEMSDQSDSYHVIEMHGYVVGTVISQCEKYLYANVRAWPENAVANPDTIPPISNQVEVRIIELDNFTVLKKVYMGHIGLTPAHRAFYLYLSVTEDGFLASGSEDGKKGGCIWDKHYGCLAAQLPHKECVNCVAFNPIDSRICATASDDHTIAIWWSHSKLRQVRQQRDKMMLV